MQLPHRFGRYTLLEKMAEGGMAEVYRARYDGEGGFVKPVAIKRILPAWSGDPEFVALLIDEAHALAYLQHQNIVQVYELGKDEETYFIAMEYVAGMDCRTLLRRLRERALSLRDIHAFYIITEVLKGLSFAHAQTGPQGVSLHFVHRDISPQNLLLSFHGEVKIADFGIAKGLHRHQQTQVAQLKGKYAYMAPEQAMGKTLDARADIFAAGVVLFELLTGTPCFDGPNDLAILDRVKGAILPDGWERRFPPAVRAMLRRALAREPAERYPSAQAFLEDITRYTMAHRLLVHGLEWAQHLRSLCPDEVAKAAAVVDAPTRQTAGPAIRSPSTADRNATRGYTMAGRSGSRHAERTDGPRRWRGWSILSLPGRRVLLGSVAGVFLLPLVILRGDHPAVAMRSPIAPAEPVPTVTAVATPPVGSIAGASPAVASPPIPSAIFVAPQPPPAPPRPREIPRAAADADDRIDDRSHPVATRGYLSVQVRPWGAVSILGVMSSREAPIGVSLAEGRYTVQVRHAATGRFLNAAAHVRGGGKTTCLASFTDRAVIRCR